MTSWSQLTALSFDSPPLADPKGKRKEVYDLTEDPTPAKKRKGNDGPEASSSSSSIPNTPEDLEKLRKLEEMKVLQLWIQTSLRMSQDWLSLPCRKSLENWKMRLITPKLISVSREKRLPFMSHLRQQARSELSLIWRSRATRPEASLRLFSQYLVRPTRFHASLLTLHYYLLLLLWPLVRKSTSVSTSVGPLNWGWNAFRMDNRVLTPTPV